MRSESTLRRWKRDLRKLIDADESRETSRIAYAMETVLAVVLSKRPGDFSHYNPVADARQLADFLRKETAADAARVE